MCQNLKIRGCSRSHITGHKYTRGVKVAAAWYHITCSLELHESHKLLHMAKQSLSHINSGAEHEASATGDKNLCTCWPEPPGSRRPSGDALWLLLNGEYNCRYMLNFLRNQCSAHAPPRLNPPFVHVCAAEGWSERLATDA